MTHDNRQTIRARQIRAYALILLMAGAASSWGYHHLQDAFVALHQAERHFDRGEWRAAIPLYRRALEKGGAGDRGIRHLVEAYRKAGDADGAAAFLESLTRDSARPGIVLALARLYEAEGRWDAIIALLQPRASRRPESPAVARRLADAYRNSERLEQAIRWYRRALEARPGSFYIRFRLAEVLSWNRQYEEAAEWFRSLLQQDPGHRPSRLYLARVLSWSGRLEEAIVQYRILLGENT